MVFNALLEERSPVKRNVHQFNGLKRLCLFWYPCVLYTSLLHGALYEAADHSSKQLAVAGESSRPDMHVSVASYPAVSHVLLSIVFMLGLVMNMETASFGPSLSLGTTKVAKTFKSAKKTAPNPDRA
jgi:hypothetical protein